MTSTPINKKDADLFQAALDAQDDSVLKDLCAANKAMIDPAFLAGFMKNAIFGGNVQAARKIIEIGRFPVETPLFDASGGAMLLAAVEGQTEIVSLLIRHKANVKDKKHLFAAIENGHEKTVDVLLDAGATLEGYSDLTGQTAMHKAVIGGSNMIKKIHGLAPQLLNSAGLADENTPLMHAITINELYAEVLLDLGANVAIAKSTGVTALHMAARHRLSPHVIEKIATATKAAGIGIDTPDKDGWTALFYAAASPLAKNTESTIKQLVVSGANVDARDIEGKTPIFYAYKNHRPDAMLALTEQGANPTLRDFSGTGLLDMEAHECKDLAVILQKTWIENERIRSFNKAKKEALEGTETRIPTLPRMKIIKKAP